MQLLGFIYLGVMDNALFLQQSQSQDSKAAAHWSYRFFVLFAFCLALRQNAPDFFEHW